MVDEFQHNSTFLGINRQLGEFFLIIGSLFVFKGIEPYLDKLQLSSIWWSVIGILIVVFAVNRLIFYEKTQHKKEVKEEKKEDKIEIKKIEKNK